MTKIQPMTKSHHKLYQDGYLIETRISTMINKEMTVKAILESLKRFKLSIHVDLVYSQLGKLKRHDENRT